MNNIYHPSNQINNISGNYIIKILKNNNIYLLGNVINNRNHVLLITDRPMSDTTGI